MGTAENIKTVLCVGEQTAVDELRNAIDALESELTVVRADRETVFARVNCTIICIKSNADLSQLSAQQKRFPNRPILAVISPEIDAAVVLEAGATEVYQTDRSVIDPTVLRARIRSTAAQQQDCVEDSQQKHALQALHTVSSNAALSYDDRIAELLRLGRKYLQMEYGVLANIDGTQYTVEHVSGITDDIPAGLSIPLSETYCERTLEQGAPLCIGSIETETPDLADRLAATEFNIAQYIGTPLRTDGTTYGTLCFFDRTDTPREFTDWDETLIDVIGDRVAYELQQEQRENALTEAKQETEEVLSRVDEAFFALDGEWHFTYLNDQAETLLQRDAESLLGENVWDAFPDAATRAFYQEYHDAMENQQSTRFEEYFDPLETWFEVSAYPSDDGLSVFFSDITAEKRREQELERYETIIETVSDGVYVLDEEGIFSFVNEAFTTLTGYDETEVVGSYVDIIKSEETIRAAEDALRELVAQFQETGEWPRETALELDIITADGEQIPCDDRMTLMPAKSSFRGTVGTLRDISERKERERKLNNLLQSTRALMRAHSQQEVCDLVVRAVEEILDFDFNAVRLYNPETELLEPIAVSTVTKDLMPERPAYKPGDGIAGRVYTTGESELHQQMSQSGEPTIHDPIGSGFVLPLGEHGVVSLGSSEVNAFNASDVQFAELLAANASAALDRALREQELREYETVMKTVNDMVFVADTDGQIGRATKPLVEQFGADRDTLSETTLGEIFTAPTAQTWESVVQRVAGLSKTETRTYEVDLLLPGEQTLPVRVDLSPLSSEMTSDSVVGSVTDISDLVSAKQQASFERDRFTYLFENIPDPIDEVTAQDGELRVRSTNTAYEQFATAAQHTDTEIPLTAVADKKLRRLVGETESVFDEQTVEEIGIETQDGRFDFLFRNVPYTANGEDRSFGIYTDITDLKRRKQYHKVINRVLRHNLRNDLNVIVGFTNELVDEIDNPQQRSYAARVQDTAQDLIELGETARQIEDVLHRDSYKKRAVTADELLSVAVKTVNSVSTDVSFTAIGDPHVEMYADDRLALAIEALVENAIEHTVEEPAVTIEIATVSEAEVMVSVADTGPGLPDAEWDIVSGAASITQLEHGSGLGLWLVRWVVEDLGGKLHRVLPDSGGTRIEITLQRSDQ